MGWIENYFPKLPSPLFASLRCVVGDRTSSSIECQISLSPLFIYYYYLGVFNSWEAMVPKEGSTGFFERMYEIVW